MGRFNAKDTHQPGDRTGLRITLLAEERKANREAHPTITTAFCCNILFVIVLQAALVIPGVTFSEYSANTKTANNKEPLFWHLIVHIDIKKG
jgi:hypothetical protein